MSEIMPSFLYLGSMQDANDVAALTSSGISHILCMAEEAPLTVRSDSLGPTLQFLHLPVGDNLSSNLEVHFPAAFTFLDGAKLAGGRVLVHCQMGISRSATVVIAYVMRSLRLSYEEALNYVRHRRRVIDPNLTFLNQLMAFGQRLAAAESETEQTAN